EKIPHRTAKDALLLVLEERTVRIDPVRHPHDAFVRPTPFGSGHRTPALLQRDADSVPALRRNAPRRPLPPCGGGTGRGVTANAESIAPRLIAASRSRP